MLIDGCWQNFSNALTFAGIDIWIEDPEGKCLRIRERRRIKVGHVAIGISDQVRESFKMSRNLLAIRGFCFVSSKCILVCFFSLFLFPEQKVKCPKVQLENKIGEV